MKELPRSPFNRPLWTAVPPHVMDRQIIVVVSLLIALTSPVIVLTSPVIVPTSPVIVPTSPVIVPTSPVIDPASFWLDKATDTTVDLRPHTDSHRRTFGLPPIITMLSRSGPVRGCPAKFSSSLKIFCGQKRCPRLPTYMPICTSVIKRRENDYLVHSPIPQLGWSQRIRSPGSCRCDSDLTSTWSMFNLTAYSLKYLKRAAA